MASTWLLIYYKLIPELWEFWISALLSEYLHVLGIGLSACALYILNLHVVINLGLVSIRLVSYVTFPPIYTFLQHIILSQVFYYAAAFAWFFLFWAWKWFVEAQSWCCFPVLHSMLIMTNLLLTWFCSRCIIIDLFL